MTMPLSASAAAFSSSGCPFHVRPTMWTKASRTCQSAALKSEDWLGKGGVVKKNSEVPKAVNCSVGSGSVRLNPRIKHQESRSNGIESIQSQESRLKVSIVKPGLQNVKFIASQIGFHSLSKVF